MNASCSPLRVAVAGAGIGGLTAALALHRRGHDVRVYERAPVIAEVGAGLMLATNAVAVLDRLGVGQILRDTCPALERVRIETETGRRLVEVPTARYAAEYGAPTICAHRADLQQTLAAALPAARIHLGHEFSGYRASGGSLVAEFANGVTAECDLLVGADGLHSRVRAAMGLDRPPRYSGYGAWRGIVHDADALLTPGILHERAGAGRRFGMVNIGKGRVYWYATLNLPANFPATRPMLPYVREAYAGFAVPVPELINATPEEACIYNPCYDRVPDRHWREGSVLLIGDAAHPTTPNLGQGACQAIEDGYLLAETLTEHSTLDAALDAFIARRAPRTAWIQSRSHQFGIMGQWSARPLVALRTLITRATPGFVYDRQYQFLFGGGPA